MPEGTIRSWEEDSTIYRNTLSSNGTSEARQAQAEFRKSFSTSMFADSDPSSPVVTVLSWGDLVSLPDGLTNEEFTRVIFDGSTGFVNSLHVVELAYISKFTVAAGHGIKEDHFKASMELTSGGSADLIWGDPVQVLSRGGGLAHIRARGMFGTVDNDRLTEQALLEVYIIDVGQGDGVLTRFPNGKHMLIDGGLEREKQMTGKNAADFVDWKFFSDYGHWKVELEWMIASHSDADHYGGLRDLVNKSEAALEELDCLEVNVGNFGHPGLSRFPSSSDPEGLGPRSTVDGRPSFTTLLGDRNDIETRFDGSPADGVNLSRSNQWWPGFLKSVLQNDAGTQFVRLGVDRADANSGAIPELSREGGCTISILGPVFLNNSGKPALPDLTPGNNDGGKSINTNGHSVCLRLDYGSSRILMTGDLNTASMQWITECYGNHMDNWACDVAKACHHGSHDVSFKFLQKIEAAATVISSGDNEGHAHPRPEIVSASALSGHVQLSADEDKVITPLIYMTEIERSVLLGEINRIEIKNFSATGNDISVLGKPVGEFSRREFLTESDWQALEGLGDTASAAQKNAVVNAAISREKPNLELLEAQEAAQETTATVFARRPAGVIDVRYPREALRRARIMEKNVYGLVNIRTDGDIIMCATKRDDGERWLIHFFNGRFN